MLTGFDSEIQFLEKKFSEEGNQIVVVYGTRGVGKSRLLKEFAQNKEPLLYTARSCSDREQRFQWGRELREEGYPVVEYPEYEELFACIFPDRTGKILLVLEEFQHLIKGEGHFFEKLVTFLENRRMSRPIMVVLQSSATGWVENNMVRKLGGAAIYLNDFLKVRELAFFDIYKMFPGYSKADAIVNYAILGGVPGLWCSFSEKLSVKENIIHNILRKESRLFQEIAICMSEELREPAVYNTILSAVAGGICKLNDIYHHTGFPRAKISVYLKNLMELNLIEKVYAGVYRITNPYMRFYFRFLFPNMSALEKIDKEAFYQSRIEPYLAEYINESYGKICRQEFARKLPEGYEVNEWIGKDYSIDMVGVDQDSRRLVSACVYGRMLEELDYKYLLKTARKAKIEVDRVLLYSENGFAPELNALENRGKVELCSVGESEI